MRVCQHFSCCRASFWPKMTQSGLKQKTWNACLSLLEASCQAQDVKAHFSSLWLPTSYSVQYKSPFHSQITFLSKAQRHKLILSLALPIDTDFYTHGGFSLSRESINRLPFTLKNCRVLGTEQGVVKDSKYLSFIHLFLLLSCCHLAFLWHN